MSENVPNLTTYQKILLFKMYDLQVNPNKEFDKGWVGQKEAPKLAEYTGKSRDFTKKQLEILSEKGLVKINKSCDFVYETAPGHYISKNQVKVYDITEAGKVFVESNPVLLKIISAR